MGNASSKPGPRSYAKTQQKRAETMRRQEAAREAAATASKRKRHRAIVRASIAAVLVLALAGGTTAIVLATSGSSEPTEASLTAPTVPVATGTLSITDPPTAYAITYKLESTADDGSTTTATETFEVRRPFDARVTGLSGPPPGTDKQWQAITNLGLYSDMTQGNDPQVSQLAPHSALADFRLDGTLGDLVAKGTFVARERRRVLDRECQVYRTGKPLESFAVAAPTETDYTDACIDASGLLLEEMTVTSGKLTQRIIATSVDDDLQATDADFAITGTPLTLAEGGSQLTPIAPGTAPDPATWVLDAPPAGYTLQGSYMLTVPVPADSSTDPTAPSTTTTIQPATNQNRVDVYVNGINTIIIQQGKLAGEPSTDARASTVTAEVGALGSAKVAVGLVGTTLLAEPSSTPDRFVQITGTVPLGALTAVVAPLRATP